MDCDGYDCSNWERPQAGDSPSNVKVFKGSLVQQATVKETVRSAPHAYKLQSLNYKDITNPTVWCSLYRDDVLPISEHQKELLLGVEDCVTRYLMINKLNWIESVQIGHEVFVLMPDQTYCKAVVHYIGNVEEAVGIRFGLELLVRLYICYHGDLYLVYYRNVEVRGVVMACYGVTDTSSVP